MLTRILKCNAGTQTLIGAILGIGAGFLFGEFSVYLRPVGLLYVTLLEMMVLPYLLFGITFSLGSLTLTTWSSALKKIWKPFIAIWIFGLFLVMASTTLIPKSIRSPLSKPTSIGNDFAETALHDLIPQNPFFALTFNYLPAITVFCIIVGLSLMNMKKKEKVTDFLSVIVKAISKIFHWLTRLAPIGTFALMTSAIGTMTFVEFDEIQFYLYAHIAFSLFMIFIFLPILLKNHLPISYKKIFSLVKTGLILCFTTGISIIAIPFILQAARRYAEIQKEHNPSKDFESITLISYSFAQVGNLVVVLFIFFAGYYYHTPLTKEQSILTPFLALFTSFGSPTTTIFSVKFFTTQWGIPADAADLYVEMLPLTRSFQTLASVMCMYVLTFIGHFSCQSHVASRRIFSLAAFSISPILFLVSIFLSKLNLISIKKQPLSYWNTTMSETLTKLPTTRYISRDKAQANAQYNPPKAIFDRIQSKGELRVGYNSKVMPFVYWNDQKELVGFDVAFIYSLANVLDMKIALIPYSWETLQTDLEQNLFDIAIGAIFMTHTRLTDSMMSRPYLSTNLVLLASKKNEPKYKDGFNLKSTKGLSVGVLKDPRWKLAAQTYFPQATIIEFSSIEDYFEQGGNRVDVFLWTDETSVAWPFKYPDFTVIKTDPPLGKKFFAYAFNKNSDRLITFVNYWIELTQFNTFFNRQYSIWVLGIPPYQPKPKWSIITAFFPSLKSKAASLALKKRQNYLTKQISAHHNPNKLPPKR